MLVCFVHFDFEMCFAPQWHALFRHLNAQRSSEHAVFLTCLLPNLLCATTACNCSSLIYPDGSAPAALASLLFDPLEPQTIRKTKRFATFSPFRLFAHLHLLSSDSFSSLIFFLLLFSDSSHPCFFICPYCRKFDF